MTDKSKQTERPEGPRDTDSQEKLGRTEETETEGPEDPQRPSSRQNGGSGDDEWWPRFTRWLRRSWWIFGLLFVWYNAKPPKICLDHVTATNSVEAAVKTLCKITPTLDLAPTLEALVLLVIGISAALWLTRKGERQARKRAKRLDRNTE